MNPLQTRLTERLGITLPILQSGMRPLAGPDLVAAVSETGGLGILAAFGTPPADIVPQIRRIRELTQRPFGVNLWLHPSIRPPIDPATVPSQEIAAAHGKLNEFRRRLNLPERSDRPARAPEMVEPAIEVLLAERVPVFSIGLGDPGPELVERFHAAGITVIAMAATVEDAKALARSGVDAIVAQGAEAGGHRSTWTQGVGRNNAAIGTMALVPQIVDAVKTPVVAAGGIADGRGLVAALALGAQAVMLGTRFVATRESAAPTVWKQAILDGGDDITAVTNVYTGLYARGIRNRFMTEYEASGAPVLPPLVQFGAAADIYAAASQRGEPGYFPMLTGQSAGLIADLPGAGEVVQRIAAEAEAVLGRLGANG